jgi:hypothetical protein
VNDGVPITIGTLGVTVTFSGAQKKFVWVPMPPGSPNNSSSSSGIPGRLQMVYGEKWYVACTGREDEGFKTLVLADDLPGQLRSEVTDTGGRGSSSSMVMAVDLGLQLFVSKDIQLTRENFPNAPDVNWVQSATQITLQSGAQVYDSDFVDALGNLVALTLDADSDELYSTMFVEYRALLQTYASDITSITDISTVVTLLGEVSTDNPLALGVWYALRNSNGTDVKFMAVPTNDLTGYSAVLDKATGRRDLYTIVPMTRNATIQNTIAAHVDALSNEIEGQWRVAFFNGSSSATDPLIDLAENYPAGGTDAYAADDLIATVIDDPDSSGTQYTRVVWDPTAYPAGGGFVDMGVRAGDLFRTSYTGDGFGGTSYSDYVVDAVLSNQTLRLVSGPSTPISVARRFSIQRSFTRTEEATAYGQKAGVFADRRIYYVWPDVIEDASGVQIEGIYLCAAIAGLISGVVPHQGLTNVALEGFTDVTRTTDYMAESQLNVMAAAGVWIVAEDPDTGSIYSRHELSTCVTTLNCRELMVVKNVDAISYTFLSQLAIYIGRANVTPRFLVQLRRAIQGTVDFLKSNGSTPSLGGQLIEAELTDLRQHAVNLDQVVVVLEIDIPYPVNVIELRLVI